MRVRALFADIDGTITENRSTYRVSIDALIQLRRLADAGVVVAFVSSNALPVVIGLQRYLGLNGPSIGETGSLVYYDAFGLVPLASASARDAYLDVVSSLPEYVSDTWQNKFRLYDFALKVAKGRDGREAYERVKEYVERKYKHVRVGYSGYAIHLSPADASKGRAVKFVLERLGIDPSEAVAVGDSAMDADLLKSVGLGVAVGNADEELKRVAGLVLDGPSGLGVAELAKLILEGKV